MASQGRVRGGPLRRSADQGRAGANRANLLKQAQQAYQFVIEKHPQDELAAQAKKRLEELSKL